MIDDQQIRLDLLRTLIQHAYELAAGLRYAEALETNLNEAYEDLTFVAELHKTERLAHQTTTEP